MGLVSNLEFMRINTKLSLMFKLSYIKSDVGLLEIGFSSSSY